MRLYYHFGGLSPGTSNRDETHESQTDTLSQIRHPSTIKGNECTTDARLTFNIPNFLQSFTFSVNLTSQTHFTVTLLALAGAAVYGYGMRTYVELHLARTFAKSHASIHTEPSYKGEKSERAGL